MLRLLVANVGDTLEDLVRPFELKNASNATQSGWINQQHIENVQATSLIFMQKVSKSKGSEAKAHTGSFTL